MIVNKDNTVTFPTEVLEALKIVTIMGAKKHGANNWMDKDNPSMQKRANYKSIAGHALDAYSGITEDHESGLDPRIHAAWRLLADYIRDTKEVT